MFRLMSSSRTLIFRGMSLLEKKYLWNFEESQKTPRATGNTLPCGRRFEPTTTVMSKKQLDGL